MGAGFLNIFMHDWKRSRSKLPLFTCPATVLYTYTTGIQTEQAYMGLSISTGPLHSDAQHNISCAVCCTSA